jgi:hypothetical protein
MTKGELRRARKAARASGQRLEGDLALSGADDIGAVTWSETPRGYAARERWARQYDARNGAPGSDWDR